MRLWCILGASSVLLDAFLDLHDASTLHPAYILGTSCMQPWYRTFWVHLAFINGASYFVHLGCVRGASEVFPCVCAHAVCILLYPGFNMANYQRLLLVVPRPSAL